MKTKLSTFLQARQLKLLLLLILFLVASNFIWRRYRPLPTIYSVNDTTLFFPRQKDTGIFKSRDVPTALISGQLTLIDGCLGVQNEMDIIYALIWPPRYGLNVENGTIQILNEKGRVVAEVGDETFIDGGETPVRNVAAIDEEMQQRIVDTCTEPYWLVGYDAQRIEELD